MYLLAPFILENFTKILRANPELWGCAILGHKMAHLYENAPFLCRKWFICPKQLFFLQNY